MFEGPLSQQVSLTAAHGVFEHEGNEGHHPSVVHAVAVGSVWVVQRCSLGW